MRKIWLIVLTVCALVSFSLAAACTDEPAGDELEFNVQAEIVSAYGDYCAVPETNAKDGYGNRYFPVVTVTDADGNEVIYENGRFFAGKFSDYVITYTLTVEGETITRQTTVRIKDLTAPVITLPAENGFVFSGEYFTVPEIAVSDDVDEDEELTVGISVTKDGSDILPEEGRFMAEESGEYIIKYTVTDTSGNSAEAQIPVSCFDKEEGNVTYFNREFGAELNSITHHRDGVTLVERSQEYVLPGEEYSLRVLSQNIDKTYVRSVYLNTPVITDISGYRYLYYWLYNDSECAVRISYNGVYDYYLVQPGEWTRVVLTKNTAGTNFTTPSSSGADVFAGITQYPASVSDISGFMILVQPEDNRTAGELQTTDVYFSTFRVTNDLVQATGGLENTTVFAGDKVTVPQVSVSGADSFEQKTFVISGGSRTEVAAGSEYTFAAAGAYTLRYEVYVGGLLSDVLTQNVSVINVEPGNLTYFNHSFGMEMCDVRFNAGVSRIEQSQTFTHGDDEYSLRVYSESVQQNMARLFWFYNPVITDVSDYQYMYFYVYNNSASGIRLSYNNVYDYYIVAPGEWTLVVLTRNAEGTNFTTPSNNKANVFNTGTASYPASVDNIYGFTVQIQTQVNNTTTPETTDVYFSSFYVSNELPSA